MVGPLNEGMDSTIVDILLIESSSISVTEDITDAQLGDIVIELVSVSSEDGEMEGSPVNDGSFVKFMTEEISVYISDVWSPEPSSAALVTMALCSVLSVIAETEDFCV